VRIVVKVDEKSQNNGFTSVSVEAVDYEGISYA
jgi:hypothetical protein